MKRRTKISCALGIFLFIAVCTVLGILIVGMVGGHDRGSPKLAAQWAKELGGYTSPVEARKANPNVVVFEFDSGQWAIALARSSHGLHKGNGTVVVADSTGTVLTLHGHVCGEGNPGLPHRTVPSLEAFHEDLRTQFSPLALP